MPHLVVPGSWHNVTRGRTRFELEGGNLDELIGALVEACPEAGYRLHSSRGELLRYHMFFVDGEQVFRTTPADEVELGPESIVEIIPALAGG